MLFVVGGIRVIYSWNFSVVYGVNFKSWKRGFLFILLGVERDGWW